MLTLRFTPYNEYGQGALQPLVYYYPLIWLLVPHRLNLLALDGPGVNVPV